MLRILLRNLAVTLSLAILVTLQLGLVTAKPAYAAWGGSSFRLTVSVSLASGGTVEIDGKSYIDYPTDLSFDSGKSVEVVAVPTIGYTFNGWSGDLTDTTNPAEIVMTCPKNITANFSRIMHNLDIKIDGGGSINPSTGSHSYAEGEIVTIVATPDDGWRFDSWTGDVSDDKSPTTKVNVGTSKSVTANFVKVFPAWLLTLIIIVAVGLVGIAGWYYAKHSKSPATKREPVANRHKADKSRKRHNHKKKRQWPLAKNKHE